MKWSYFDKFDNISDLYLPARGEGETMATQIVTAVCKLVYKWYNDGDVFDNTYHLRGWCNDLSSYANWLDIYTDAGLILNAFPHCKQNSDYEDILAALADKFLNEECLAQYDKPKQGSIYECEGRWNFEEPDDYDDEEYDDYDDDYDED